MNKRKYYKLLNEYQEELSRKNFNKTFYSDARLKKIKKQLLEEISESMHRVELYHLNGKPHLLRLNYLHVKIEREEVLKEDDYKNTYYELLLFDVIPQKLFWVGLGILIIGVMLIILAIREQ